MKAETILKAKLEEWGKAKEKANRINAAADGQLEDLLATYEAKAEPILSERDRKLGPVLADLQNLEREITNALLKEVKPDGAIGIPQLDTEKAFAQVTVDRKRKLDPAEFMRSVHPRERHKPEFFACLTVLVTEAEKFLDKPTMQRLTGFKLSPSVVLKLKD